MNKKLYDFIVTKQHHQFRKTTEINFDKSLTYYLKDKEQYLPCECHINTYLKFYDYNYPEVEKRMDSFKYVTGLLLIDDGVQKKLLFILGLKRTMKLFWSAELSLGILEKTAKRVVF